MIMTKLDRILQIAIVALFVLTAAARAADTATEITLPGTRIFPESITSTSDGTIIVGSFGHGNLLRILPGKVAEEWIKPGTNGLNTVLGVYADEPHRLLWVCSDKLAAAGDPTAVKTFDLSTGAPKGSFGLPGENAFCNDIAVAPDGTAYISDTNQGTLDMLKPGAKAFEVAAKDALLAGADGLGFTDRSTIYVNSFTTGKLLRVELGPDGKSKAVVDLKLPRKLDRPDGMRSLSGGRFLMVENSGVMSLVSIKGDTVGLTSLKEGLVMTPAVTATRGMAWVAEGKLDYASDPKLKDKDPGAFKLYAVPLPKN
jgi:sugar lactone lactonase YvrE